MTSLEPADREALLADGEPDAQRGLAGAEQLDRVEAFIRRYVVVSSAQSCALALWVAHTHCAVAAEATPYIAVTSPERRSGKTRLLEVLELVCARPLRSANLSEAALFRTIDEERVTLLLDEADAIFTAKGERENLRGLVNAGYRRGAVVLRCEVQGKKIATVRHDAFGPKVIAAIGHLPETITDRSIPIRLQRKHRTESVHRFRLRHTRPEGESIRARLASFFEDPELEHRLENAHPDLPDQLDDRAQDGWEPLLAIADLVGGSWRERARVAAVELHSGDPTDSASAGVLLLSHVRDAFTDRGTKYLATADLLASLCDREDGPWPGWWANDVEAGRTKGPASKLARILRSYDIRPSKVGPRDERVQGYTSAAFSDAWSRYLPVSDPENGHTDTRRSEGLFDPDALVSDTSSDLQVSECPFRKSDTDRNDGHRRCTDCGSLVHATVGSAHRCPTLATSETGDEEKA